MDKLRETYAPFAQREARTETTGLLSGDAGKNWEGAGVNSSTQDHEEQIAELFRYHPPSLEQTGKYEAVRDAAKYLATVLIKNVPRGADRTAAIRKLREAVMTANAGIALNGISL